MKRIIITHEETGGLIFDGTEEQFQDCFFTNSDEETIADWSRKEGFAVRYETEDPATWVHGTKDGKCTACGHPVESTHNFCPTCGAGLIPG